jgi:hypothetical protein
VDGDRDVGVEVILERSRRKADVGQRDSAARGEAVETLTKEGRAGVKMVRAI